MKKKSSSHSAFFNLRVLVALLIATACSTLIVPLLAFQRENANKSSQRTLTFQERVSYQRAIEEVYWRHRIWPKENSNPKPSLDAVISQVQLEKKVTDYLRNSQALGDYWQRPITAEQLQAEMDRMAQHTRQPEVLQKLFDALGNDPFVIAECLARPALAERLITNWYAYDQRIHGDLKQRAQAELQAHPSIEQMKQLSGKYTEIEFVKSDDARNESNHNAEHSVKLDSRGWNETIQKLAATFSESGSNQLNAQPCSHGAVSPCSTAQNASAQRGGYSNSPQTKNADLQAYQTIPIGKLSPLQEDERRYHATAVLSKSNDRFKLATVSWLKEPLESWMTNTQSQVSVAMPAPGGNYTLPKISEGGCVEDTWTATNGAPSARLGQAAVWTGTEMIIWGGSSGDTTGGRYNPSTDTWTPTSTTNAPDARSGHTAVWTGSEMIIWGGGAGGGLVPPYYFITGGRYNPITDSWIATSTTNAPEGRGSHTAIWTGSEMIIWGGARIKDPYVTYLNTGGKYNPSTDTWAATTTTNAPDARADHTAIWTGGEMLVWGGANASGNFNTGGIYNPNLNGWAATNTANAPTGRVRHTAVWTGSQMIIWGGYDGNDTNAGGRYNRSTNSWTATSTVNAPEARGLHTAVWTGTKMIVWGGHDGPIGDLNTGGRYDPGNNSWTATSTVNAPTARQLHSAVWTGSEMIVWGGTADTSGGKYNPNMDSWTPTATAPAPRYLHTAVWTGSEMIVWGGISYPDVVDTGGRYNLSTDSWTATSITNAPDARYRHTAVWTGSEMIVWGGWLFLNTGGKYNPISDSWTATTTANAPVGRYAYTAVWTGTEMIVWGGDDGNFDPLNTGGRYDPGTDSWTATSITNAPDARDSHTAIWAGSEMIVWGGAPYLEPPLNTGGRYNPDTDSWTPTSTVNAPEARSGHTAVWTDTEMIVWGGTADATGGRYNPNTDSWAATSTINAPAPAMRTAVWTGTEMIVWGSIIDSSGGRYNPSTDTWTPTSTTNAPSPRWYHTAVWTGNEMIAWGGANYNFNSFNSGGRYCALGGPTPTPSPTPTPTATPRATPRPRPTPAPRPTPH